VDTSKDSFDTYVEGLTLLNQLRVICSRIEFYLDNKNYTFVAYQVSQLYQVLSSMSGSTAYLQSIQNIFNKLKDPTTFNNPEAAESIHNWYGHSYKSNC
jgi:hypothetical protein